MPAALTVKLQFGCAVACLASLCAACTGDSSSPPQAALDAASTAGTAACVPGLQVACSCSDGTSGISICLETGRGFETCRCELPAPASSGTAPAHSLAQPGAGGPPRALEPARGVRIAEIALYQTVKIPLMRDGAAVTLRNAPVIAGKGALLRVFIATLPGFRVRELKAEVELVSAGRPTERFEATQRIAADSDDARLMSSLNVHIPAAAMTVSTEYAVSVWETGAPPDAVAVDADVRWPQGAGERVQLGSRDPGPLRIMFVPYRYLADGSHRLPALDDRELSRYEAALRGLYPATDLEFQMHEPVDYDEPLGPTTGWEEWIDFHCALRARENPDPKLLYYGMVAPAESWEEYGGGVVGISPVPNAASDYGRCSVGVGFRGFATTMVHELGHALGLDHAPCGTDGGPYPYADASIGSWGLALPTQTLIDPAKYHDMMSYCEPVYISDFNYQRLFQRIRYLNVQFDVQGGAASRGPGPGTYQRVLVDRAGTAKLRGAVQLDRAPGDAQDTRMVTLLGRDGAPRLQPAYFFSFSEAQGGLWLIPDHPEAMAIQFDDASTVPLR